jgi:hypothetical protein
MHHRHPRPLRNPRISTYYLEPKAHLRAIQDARAGVEAARVAGAAEA